MARPRTSRASATRIRRCPRRCTKPPSPWTSARSTRPTEPVKASAARLLLLAAALPAASLAAGEDAAKEPDCPGLRALPFDSGSREDRRITCDIPGPLRLQVQQAEERGLRLRRHDLAAFLSSGELKKMHAF